MRLIDADELTRQKQLEAMGNGQYEEVEIVYGTDIDNAPTIEPSKLFKEFYEQGKYDAEVERAFAEPSGDIISRAEVLALINKAMYNTDNKDIQDYLFCGLRRDVHNLPSADRPTVIRAKTFMPTKDFNEWAKRIREVNPNAVVIPCDAEVVSADRPTLKQTDTLIIADALRYLVQDTERHESDRTRAEELRKQILQYGASMCHSADRPQGEPEPAPVVAYICDRRICAICSGPDGGCDHTTDIKHAAHFKNVAGQYFERPYMEEEDDG